MAASTLKKALTDKRDYRYVLLYEALDDRDSVLDVLPVQIYYFGKRHSSHVDI